MEIAVVGSPLDFTLGFHSGFRLQFKIPEETISIMKIS